MAREANRVTVGYQDGCLHPLWMSSLGMRIATALGAETIWLPDHFMGFAPKWMWTPDAVPVAKMVHSMDALFDPVPLLALGVRRHRRTRFGTAVTDSIRRHPMSLAQTFATLDHIGRGRVILGIGNGIRENTEPYGFPYEQQVARLEEALRVIRLLWSSGGEPVSFDGRFWRLRDAVFDLPLFGGKPPPIYIGAHYPRMLRLCGRFADGWLPGQKIEAGEYRARLDVIRKAAEEAGRSMDNFTPCQTLLVAFGPNRDEIRAKALRSKYVAYMAMGMPPAFWEQSGARHPLGPDFAGFLDLVPSRIRPEQVEDAMSQLKPELIEPLFYTGTPEQIFEDAAPLAAAGCRHFIVANMGAMFTGSGLGDFWQMGKLFRLLRRL